ncbi:unnamed protein product [Kuraishia capsulata CBS 1993]|uniref:Serine/threonine-protein phosphatase 2A activator n=1 Tax=Kuraishia capsulata CBS 1993 TaxID=1382522 RepID=W6MMI0_9ASCO|nr:uncharacterized protein KUCA_T00003386001 [Kuraishia capsulata CBS 1993]CDK27408.1 unnamed protein product [Kuraishia capsulata CBS 1993]
MQNTAQKPQNGLLRLDPSTVQSDLWKQPVKRIHEASDLVYFHQSVALHNIQATIIEFCQLVSFQEVPEGVLDDSIVSIEENARNGSHGVVCLAPPTTVDPGFQDVHHPAGVRAVLKVLSFLEDVKKRCPPLEGPRRFGNMAFRTFHDTLAEEIDEILGEAFGPLFHFGTSTIEEFVSEAKYYLVGSLGSRNRLDYGTGHELSFLAFVSGLLMCGIIEPEELKGTDILTMFGKYYDLVKELILSYTLEPAGSHGVWGLDDHFHLIYILGAAQLVNFSEVMNGGDSRENRRHNEENMRQRLTPAPRSVLNSTSLRRYRTKNLYFNAISFIKKVKSGPFNEHSPVLYDISSSKPWEKISKGMVKMYYAEVLSKFPVVQHFYFGGVLFPWKDQATGKALPETTPEETGGEFDTEASPGVEDSQTFDARNQPTLRNTHGSQFSRRSPPVRGSVEVPTKAPWAR